MESHCSTSRGKSHDVGTICRFTYMRTSCRARSGPSAVCPCRQRWIASPSMPRVCWRTRLRSASSVTGWRPLAFCGGAYRFNPVVLAAFAKNGIQLSANYYSAAKYWSERRPQAGPFRWPNGMLELPVSTATIDGAFRYAIFENLAVDSFEALSSFLSATSASNGALDVSSFVLHSWSLLRKDDSGKFTAPDESKVKRFQGFLHNLSAAGYRSATTETILETAAREPMLSVTPYAVVFGATDAAQTAGQGAPEMPPKASTKPTMPTLVAPAASTGKATGEGGAAASCLVCGAERSTSWISLDARRSDAMAVARSNDTERSSTCAVVASARTGHPTGRRSCSSRPMVPRTRPCARPRRPCSRSMSAKTFEPTATTTFAMRDRSRAKRSMVWWRTTYLPTFTTTARPSRKSRGSCARRGDCFYRRR